jgi:predicted transcriptional regulator
MINTNKRKKMDTIDKLINSTKQLALIEMKEKIQEEIDKLELEREDAEKIPF